MRNILITIKKELRSIFRDKKTMIAMFIYPILIPFMVILYGSIGDDTTEGIISVDAGFNYKISNEEKILLDHLKVKYKEYETKEELEKAYEEKDIKGYVIKESEDKYTIYIDESNTEGLTAGEALVSYLESYNQILSSKYVASQGLDPIKTFNQITYETESLEKTNYMVFVLLAVSLTYTILAICISASNMAISTTATEKENGTLETILTFPIKKGELITGKYASSVIIGFIASIISLILMLVSFKIGSSHYEIFKGISLNTDILSILGCLLVSLMASIFIAGIAMFLTSFSKSYKEAQSKVSMINTLGIIPMFVSLFGAKVNLAYYLIPICNYEQTLQEILIGKLNMLYLVAVIVSTIVYTFIVVKLIIKLYNSEKILFYS